MHERILAAGLHVGIGLQVVGRVEPGAGTQALAAAHKAVVEQAVHTGMTAAFERFDPEANPDPPG